MKYCSFFLLSIGISFPMEVSRFGHQEYISTLFDNAAQSLVQANKVTYGKKIGELNQTDKDILRISELLWWDVLEKIQRSQERKKLDDTLGLTLKSYQFVVQKKQEFNLSYTRDHTLLVNLFKCQLKKLRRKKIRYIDISQSIRIIEIVTMLISDKEKAQQINVLNELNKTTMKYANRCLRKESTEKAKLFLELCKAIKVHKIEVDQSERGNITIGRTNLWNKIRQIEQEKEEEKKRTKNEEKMKPKVKKKKRKKKRKNKGAQ